jgi:hypothetical protein
MAEVIFTVTVPGGTIGGYYIDGVQKPIVPVVTGGTFRFNQNDSTNNGHPLILSTTTSTAGIISTGVVYYLDGISNSTDYRNTTLFNAATVRYIEITVSQTSDFYYICNVHGSGMGNVMDITTDTWGALFWGAGGWEQQGDSFTDVNGVISSVLVNSIEYTGEPGGWGFLTWGANEWNDLLNPNVDIIGLQLNTSVGNEEAFTDITVNVSTDLLNISISSPLIIIGVLIEPASFLLNTTVNSIFGGESIIAEVVTPGTPTTWGQSTFGNYSWNQITGTQSEIGDEFAFTDVNVQLNTNLLTVTLNPNYEVLIGILIEATGNLITSTVNSVFAGELIISNVTGITINSTSGDESITADANVTPNTNLLNIIIGDESIVGDANLILSTNLLNAAVGNVGHIIDAVVEVTTPGSPSAWGEYTWGQQAWGRIVGLEVDQGAEEVVVPSIEVDVIGIQLSTTVASLSVTADANITAITNLLTISLGDEDVTPNTIVTLSTNLLNVGLGTASGEVLSTVDVIGVNMTTSTGRLYITAWAVVDIGVTNTWTVVDIAA